MKQYIAYTAFILVLFAFFSCKKDPVDLPDTSIPDPSDTAIQRNFKLVFISQSGNWNGSGNLTALVTIENQQTPDKLINLTIPVLLESQNSTPVLKLPKGSYKIQQLMLNSADGTTRFATPRTGSAKAGQISKPLGISMILEEKVEKEVGLEVLAVGENDTPQNFGYPTGSFGKNPNNPQPPMDKRVFIRTLIKIGEVVFDSIPAQLVVKSWDAKEEMDYKIHFLGAGTQAIYLPAKAVRFHLSVGKWGTYSELSLTQSEVHENAVYDIGGFAPAKKLKSVVEVRVVGGVSTPQTKTDYEYHSNGEIKQRLIWGKRADNATFLMQTDLFNYTNGNITSIKSYGENDAWLKTLTARYNSVGRVIALEESREQFKTEVTANYLVLETRSGLTQDYRIDAQYLTASGGTDYYNKTMHGGTVIHDSYVASNGGFEEGTYDYDFFINPYIHLRIPDMFFTQYTKHNMVFSRIIRRGGFPMNEPYDFKYTYDGDGYPKELVTKYRSTSTKADVFSLRTVFTYY